MFKNILNRLGALRRQIERVGIPSERTVLLVTMSSLMQTDLRILSIQEGWHILFARSVDAALYLSTVHKIAVVIYDQELPGANWRDALRSLVDAAPVCFILLSSFVDRRFWKTVLDIGGYDVAQKPLNARSLVPLVNGALELTNSVESVLIS